MFDRINNWVNELNLTDDDENFDNNNINCNYVNIDEFKDLKRSSNESFSMLHLNIHSLQLHIDELQAFLNVLNFKFDIIALCETKLQNEPSANVSIEGYNILIFTYTEANKGGVCIYVADNLNFKLRNDLNIYESKELELVFIEIVNAKKANNIVGVIYRHPSMEMDTFNMDKFELLLSKLNCENNKYIYIAGDLNFDMVKVNLHDETSIFFNKMMSNLLFPVVTIPTKINTVNDTLIDNIFTHHLNPEMVSGNFSIEISDHLPSFLIVPNKSNIQISKYHNIYTRDFDKLDKEDFLLDLLDLNLDEISDNPNANDAFNDLYVVTNEVIDRYIPALKITNKKYKRRYKTYKVR